MSFVEKLDIVADLKQMQNDLENFLLAANGWPAENPDKKLSGNQLSLSFRPGATDLWLDATGSLYNTETGQCLGKESDFTEINPAVPDYTRSMLEKLSKQVGVKFGRIRYMRLMPKAGLSIHADAEQRYHLALDTNEYALFGQYTGEDKTVATCYHIPADGHFYKVDTREKHFVFNGGWKPRIHLVICEA